MFEIFVVFIFAPNDFNIISVWSLVILDSLITVSPFIFKAASNNPDFICADGITGYSGIQLRPDTTKIANVFPQYNKLSNVDVIIEPGGFTVPILKLNSDDDYVDQEACGIRYYGSGFDVIYIGAPIWHMQSEDAKILGDKILEDMGFWCCLVE